MRTLDISTAVEAGGWDPRWAKVLAVRTHGNVGAAIVDTNGDGADIDLDHYTRAPDGDWMPGISGNIGDEGSSHWVDAVVCWGRAAPGAVVDVEYLGARHTVTTAPTGWWLFLMDAKESESALPHRV